ALLAGLALAAGTLLFRANVFVLAFPAWLAAAGLSLPYFRTRRLQFAILATRGPALALLAGYPFIAHPATGSAIAPALELFPNEIHLNNEPTAYTGWYEHLRTLGNSVAFPAGVLLVFPACLGAFLVLYPAALLLARRRLRAIDAFPWVIAAFYLLLM